MSEMSSVFVISLGDGQFTVLVGKSSGEKVDNLAADLRTI